MKYLLALFILTAALPARAENPQREVSLDWEKPKATAPKEVKDIFGAKTWYVPPPPPPPKKALPPPPPPPPTAPPLPFSFLGKLLSAEGRNLYYLVRADRVYSVSEGDVIDNTYRVEKAVGNQLQLIYLPLNITQSINIGTGS